jgi:N-acetyl sugar amidotransferase
MDTTVPTITFDAAGVCNYCHIHDRMAAAAPTGPAAAERLAALVARIKASGKGREYDCIVGVSGGTDSTYTLLMASQHGLRPLAVHYDNGWNSELSVANIEQACRRLAVDLHTEVADWEEFKDIQVAFLKASVPDVEMPSDLGIFGTLYQVAAREGIRYILTGASFRTEGKIPLAWGYGDGRYLKAIHARYGSRRMTHFPNLTLGKLFNYIVLRRIRVIRFLEYTDYTKEGAKGILARELGWRDYGGHHYESIYTRYYQAHISRVKFGMDRRKVTLSAAVREGAMARERALAELARPPLPPDRIEEDERYIIKKLGLSPHTFRHILARPPRSFLDYPSYYPLFKTLRAPINLAYRLGFLPSRFYEEV